MSSKSMNRKTCEECRGNVVRKKVDYTYLGVNLGKFEAEVCEKCGETVFDEDVTQKVAEIAKKKGLYGLASRVKISQVGNSIALIINKKIARFANLKRGEEVTLYPENKRRIIIEI